jgi:phytanoyl-CoA hydroxylase
MQTNEPLYAQENPQTSLGSLTLEQVAFYRREGYLVLPSLLTPEDLMGVQKAMNEKVEEIAMDLFEANLISQKFEDAPFESRLARLFDALGDSEFLKYGRSWRERRPGYYDLMCNPKIIDAIESLIGSEIFSNPVYNVRPKVPKVAAGAVPWHQDKSYWPGANANPVITVWIPLVDATLENGCLHIWPRTHNTELLSYHKETYTGTGYTELDDKALEPFKKIKEVAIPLDAGGAILFNDRCIHKSTPNNADTVRWSVDLRYQPTDQNWMAELGAGFLCRSKRHPERVATLEDWLAGNPEHL